MSALSRRGFLGGVAGAGALALLPPEMVESFAEQAVPGELFDVKHVIVLMQENRSFDHYYGTMSGVRGFGDRTAVTLPGGRDAFHQPVPGGPGARLPYWMNTAQVAALDNDSLDHEWRSQQQARANGLHNGWIAAKSHATMGYFRAEDIPFHRALADAYTICDAYHCSVLGPTTPNRLYLFSGTIDPNGHAGGPVISNPPDYRPVFRWRSYPEFLSEHGVSWRVYANDEVGDDSDNHPFLGDYGDNPLWLFHSFHANYGSDLSARGSVFRSWKPASGVRDSRHVLADFIADCRTGTLPEVSWLVAPYGYCEHPAARPDDGAAYIRTVLTALWSNQELWNSTAVFINYDENDGLFDHVPPPTPPLGTPDEFVGGQPIGLGFRVPMTVISPWSRGGWVNSELFDHTSVIRFIEAWKHPTTPFPNISAWRRAVCGDLTSCFNFTSRRPDVPTEVITAPTPVVAGSLPPSQPPPLGQQNDAAQDAGSRSARPIPYQPTVTATVSPDGRSLALMLSNAGRRAVCLSARDDRMVRQYTVSPGSTLGAGWSVAGRYDVTVHGPNRFVWQYAGDTRGAAATLTVDGHYTDNAELMLTLTNTGSHPQQVTVTAQHYHRLDPGLHLIPAGATTALDPIDLRSTGGWYDFAVTVSGDSAFRRRFTGHYEDGTPSVTG